MKINTSELMTIIREQLRLVIFAAEKLDDDHGKGFDDVNLAELELTIQRYKELQDAKIKGL